MSDKQVHVKDCPRNSISLYRVSEASSKFFTESDPRIHFKYVQRGRYHIQLSRRA